MNPVRSDLPDMKVERRELRSERVISSAYISCSRGPICSRARGGSEQDLCLRYIAEFNLWFTDDADDDADEELIFSGCEPPEAFS